MPDWSTGRGQTKSTSPTSPIRGSGTRCLGRWNSLAQAGNSSRRGTTSNKKPSPSGRVGRGVSTLTPKKNFLLKKHSRQPKKLQFWERKVLLLQEVRRAGAKAERTLPCRQPFFRPRRPLPSLHGTSGPCTKQGRQRKCQRRCVDITSPCKDWVKRGGCRPDKKDWLAAGSCCTQDTKKRTQRIRKA